MKILIIYRHFWPDTPPYASMLRSIGGHLAQHGHEVTLWTEMPSYKSSSTDNSLAQFEVVDGIKVERLKWLPFWRRSRLIRLLDKIIFPVRTVAKAIYRRMQGQKFDVIWTATMPPVVNGISAALSAKILGARFIYHFQDIYPELGSYSGSWSENGIIYRVLMMLEKWTGRQMSQAVVLSDDMAQSLVNRGVPQNKIRVINNFMLDNFDSAEGDYRRDKGKFQIIFAGNIGRFQGLDSILEAAIELSDISQIEFLFLGEGVKLESLKEKATQLDNIRFLPHMPFEQAKDVIAAADLGIVSILPDIYKLAYPSKTLTYLGLGLPILAIVEPEAALAKMVEKEHIGVVSAGRDAVSIAIAVRRAFDDRDNLQETRTRAMKLYEREFSSTIALERWKAMIDEQGEHQ